MFWQYFGWRLVPLYVGAFFTAILFKVGWFGAFWDVSGGLVIAASVQYIGGSFFEDE